MLPSIRQQLVTMMGESTIVQGVVTMLLIVTDCTIYLQGREPPQSLYALTVLVMGFWFGQKVGQQSKKVLEAQLWQQTLASQTANPGPTLTNSVTPSTASE